MAHFDITTLTVGELLELRREIDDVVAEKREAELGRLREEMTARAEALGVSLVDVMSGARRRRPRGQANGAHT